MRILIASPYPPWPLNCGGNVAQFSALECLAPDHEFTFVCPVYNRERMASIQELSARLPKVKWRGVYCGKDPLNPSLPFRILRRLVREGQKWLRQRAANGRLPDYPFHPIQRPLVAAIEDELKAMPDLCQVEFVEMLSLGAWLPRDIPKLFIHHQLHFVYSRRFLETHGTDDYSAYLHAVMQVQELAYLRHFEGVITFSEEDRQVLQSHLPSMSIWSSPFPTPADVGIAEKLTGDFDGRFLFLALEKHEPNRDALNWLVADIWPKITKEIPSARLVVVGHWSNAAVTKYSSSSISFAGYVENLPKIMQNAIMLVPLRIGSGIRVKILAALARGIPVVSTPVGAEGLLASDGEELLVCEKAPDFAAAAVKLAREPALRLSLANAGRNAVLKHYSPQGVRQRRNEIYSNLVGKRQPASQRI